MMRGEAQAARHPCHVALDDAAEMRDLGIRRISVGGLLAMIGWSAVIDAAKPLAGGWFTNLDGGEAKTFLEGALAVQ